MVTYFNKKDMLSFGRYMASPEKAMFQKEKLRRFIPELDVDQEQEAFSLATGGDAGDVFKEWKKERAEWKYAYDHNKDSGGSSFDEFMSRIPTWFVDDVKEHTPTFWPFAFYVSRACYLKEVYGEDKYETHFQWESIMTESESTALSMFCPNVLLENVEKYINKLSDSENSDWDYVTNEVNAFINLMIMDATKDDKSPLGRRRYNRALEALD